MPQSIVVGNQIGRGQSLKPAIVLILVIFLDKNPVGHPVYG